MPPSVSRWTCSASLLLALSLLAPRASLADWPSSSLTNVPVCTADNNQVPFGSATDGAGGVIVSWQDNRLGSAGIDVYLQRVLANGGADPAWPVNGRAMCTASGDQSGPRLLADGAGGAMLVWQDRRGGATSDVYVHHVLASGIPDPAWPANGLAVCTAPGNQQPGAIISDGGTGAIVTWRDFRDSTQQAVFAQHVLATGQIDSGWPANGRLLLTQPNTFNRPIAIPTVTDNQGGAIVAWEYYGGGATADIYAQRMRANGTLDPAWPVSGRVVCAATNDQLNPRAVVDRAGGVIVCWDDARGVAQDIYAQRIRADGTADPAWPADGRLVCGAGGNQQVPIPTADGSGGVMIAWADIRGGISPDVYVQHVLSTGAVDPGWPVDGRAVCTAVNAQNVAALVNDGAGGVILTWSDQRSVSSSTDIYAHHVLPSGAVDPAWPVDGLAISTAIHPQSGQLMIADGSGGAILAWADQRGGGTLPNDVYAQRVQANGQLGGTVVGVPREALRSLTLDAVRPNPRRNSALTLSYSLQGESPAMLEVLDIVGRRIGGQTLAAVARGRGSVTIDFSGHLAPGIYMARLVQDGVVRMRRFAVLE
jgi:hypothetical protein